MPFWLPDGTVLLTRDRGRGPRPARQAGLDGDQDPAGARRGAVAPIGPLRQLPREHVLHRARRARASRRAPLRAQADELPRGLPRVRVGAPLLPRAAAAAGRVRPRVAVRARGGAARAAAGAGVHPGRRARLLHPRPGHRRGRRDLRRDRRAVRAVRLRRGAGRARPGPRSRSGRTRSGSARSPPFARPSSARAASTRSARARGRSTDPRSTSTSPTRSADRGSAAPASSTSRCRSASSSPTRDPTTRRTGR